MKQNHDDGRSRPEHETTSQQFMQMLVQPLLANKFSVLVIVVIALIDRLVPQPDAANEWLVYQGAMVVMFMTFNAVVLGYLLAKSLMIVIRREKAPGSTLFAEYIGDILRGWAWASVLILLPKTIIEALADPLYQTYQEHPEILLGICVGFVICTLSLMGGAIYWFATRSLKQALNIVAAEIFPLDKATIEREQKKAP